MHEPAKYYIMIMFFILYANITLSHLRLRLLALLEKLDELLAKLLYIPSGY